MCFIRASRLSESLYSLGMIKALLQKAIGKRATPISPHEDVPRYPPYARGLSSVSVDDLLVSQRELITKISYTTRYDEAHFLQWYYPAIRRYARFVHLLPASETHHHRGVGGLLRHGLEASQEALARITNGGTALGLDVLGQERRRITPVWELACFLAGLMHDMGKAVTDMKVTSMDGRHTWDPFKSDLIGWLRDNKIDRYCVRFNQGPRHKVHELCTTLVANYVLADDLKSYISQTAPGVLEKLLAAISGTVIGRNIIHDHMLHADHKSVEHDLKTNRLEPGINSEVGTPIERNLIDAMRRLVKDGTWKPNTPGHCLWMINNSLFIAWKKGSDDLTRSLTKFNVPGIPRDPDVQADILIERDLAKPCLHEGQSLRYWKIAPEVLQKGGEKQVEFQVLRLSAPELIIDPPPPSVNGLILSGATPAPTPVIPSAPPAPASAPATAAANRPGATPLGPPTPSPPNPVQATPDAKNPVQTAPSVPHAPPPPLVEEPWNLPGAVSLDLEEPLPADQDDARPDASAELILPEALGAGPAKRPSPKKMKKTGSPSERMAATATLVETPSLSQDDNQDDASRVEVSVAEFFETNLAGSVLHAIASDLCWGRAKWGKDVITLESDLVAIRYPEGFGGLGCDPREILQAMDGEGWIAFDPQAPLRKVQEVDGFVTGRGKGTRKAVVLESIASQPFLVVARSKKKTEAIMDEGNVEGNSRPENKAPEAKTVSRAEDASVLPVQLETQRSQIPETIKVIPEPAPVETLKNLTHSQELIALIGAENGPFQTTQLGGRVYIQHDEAHDWLVHKKNLSLFLSRRTLNSELFVTITENGTKLIGPA